MVPSAYVPSCRRGDVLHHDLGSRSYPCASDRADSRGEGVQHKGPLSQPAGSGSSGSGCSLISVMTSSSRTLRYPPVKQARYLRSVYDIGPLALLVVLLAAGVVIASLVFITGRRRRGR